MPDRIKNVRRMCGLTLFSLLMDRGFRRNLPEKVRGEGYLV